MYAEQVQFASPSRPTVSVLSRIVRSGIFAALLRDRLTSFAAIFLAVVVFSGMAASFVAPYDPMEQKLSSRLLPPTTTSAAGFHILGTDELGRDILSRLIYGSRVTLAVAVGAVLVSALLGTVMGLISGYTGGWLDNLLMRIVDLTMAFPLVLLALVLLYVLGPSMQNVIIVLGVVRWPLFARLARSSTLCIKEEEYIHAATAIGCKSDRIIFRHILPNALTPLFVLTTLEVAANILTESTLSFLGMGVQPPDASWGLMLAAGRQYILTSPWLIAIPGLAIFTTVLCINLVGMWLRVLKDPLQSWRLTTPHPRTELKSRIAAKGSEDPCGPSLKE
jgi:peptide/nickel transport system permease protein